MRKILGLDLGTTSIGWAVVNEAENENETSSIVKLGVRVNPLSVDESTKFQKGDSITTNAGRTLKRSARRNLHEPAQATLPPHRTHNPHPRRTKRTT